MGGLVGARGQYYRDPLYDVSGTISSSGAAQLLLPVALSRSSLIIQNISDTAAYITIGAPPAHFLAAAAPLAPAWVTTWKPMTGAATIVIRRPPPLCAPARARQPCLSCDTPSHETAQQFRPLRS